MRGQNYSKVISYIIVAVIITICTNLIWTMTSNANAAGEPIRLGFPFWAPNFFSYLAQEKGFFEKNNVEVEIILIQNSAPILNKYANGDLDGMIAVYSDVLYLNSEGVNSKIVYASDFSNTADVIIGKANTTLGDLKGKKISVEGVNSFSHLFVLKALENAGLSEGNVEFVDLPGQNVTEGLDKGTIVAGHTYEPYTTQALKKGYKILFAAGNFPGIITNVLAFHPNVVEERPQDIQAIIKSIIEAQKYYENNKEESLKIMSNKTGIGEQEIKSGLDGVTLPSLKDNVVNVMNSKSNETVSLFSSGKYISQFFLDRGQISENPDLIQILDPEFVNALYEGQK